MIYLIALTLLFAPTYAIKLDIFGLPANFLMLWVFSFGLFFLLYLFSKKQLPDFFTFVKNLDKKVLILTGLFFLSSIVSLFIKGLDQKKLGQFLVLFLQPISLFFIAGFMFHKNPKAKPLLLNTCYLLLGLMGLYAIIQYFTLIGLPNAYWGNANEPKRALSFFIHPNFYALFSAPLLALLIPDLASEIKDKGLSLPTGKAGIGDSKLWAWIIGALGLLLSMSRAGWLGLAAAVLVHLIVAADKKIRKMIFAAVIIIVLLVVSIPVLRYRVILPLYGEKSAVSRLSLWHTGITAIKESPIFGLGLTGFSQNWDRLNKDQGLTETHNFPHNIFLDLWVETGSIGLISLMGLIGLYIYRGLKNRRDLFALGVGLFLITLMLQGQIDNPYFKNDLAIVFWIVLALGI